MIRTNRMQLNGGDLKRIAALTMLIDHTAVVLVSDPALYWTMRLIGRLAFPIYCFLLAEGFYYTRHAGRYAAGLLLFALISEVPFNLAVMGRAFDPSAQNVFFTLFLGVAAMEGLQRWRGTFWKQMSAVLIFAGAASWLRTDYGAFGVLYPVMLFYLRDQPGKQRVFGCLAVCWEVTAPLAFVPIGLYDGTRGRQRFKYIFYGFYPVHLLILWWIGRMI